MDFAASEDDTDAGDVENQTDKAKEVAEMRLIDADALETRVEAEFDGVCVYDVSGTEAAQDFCDIIDTALTIDVIPVSFVDDLMHGDDPDVSKAAWRVMRAWRKHEHEAG